MGFEARFPSRLVARLAPRETASRRHYRPVYSIHRWWARRPGTVFRSVLLAAFSEGEGPGCVARRFFEPLGGGLLSGKLVLDPFMGGGTTVFEALRLGASVVGLDVNPVAWWITRQSVVPVDAEALEAAYRQVEKAVGRTLRSYYVTRCPICNAPVDGLYFFWVKELDCPSCGERFPLHPNHRLARYSSGDFAVFCPRCGEVATSATVGSECECPHCGYRYIPTRGNVNRGRYTCPSCSATGTVVEAVQGRDRPLDHRLVAVEYCCPEHGRGYKRADSEDKERYEAASREFRRLVHCFRVPSQAIRPGTNTDQMRRHGYRYWRDMFNDRQLLCLGLLLNAILALHDRAVRELMITLFSDVLDYNNMFCDYNYSYRKIGNLFGLHAFNVSMRPVENNLWGVGTGSGTFSRFYRKLVAAKQYARCPAERDVNGLVHKLPQEAVSVEPISDAPGTLPLDGSSGPVCALLCRDSRSIPLRDGTVDAVITDPPYFDNVMYGELSEFYYVWLHGALGDSYPQFGAAELRAESEVTTNPGRGTTPEDYVAGLTSVLSECSRVLKPGAPLVFTFHHRSIDAWVALLQALTVAGFVVETTVPVDSEMPSSIHIRGKRAPMIDVVLACRHRSTAGLPNKRAPTGDWDAWLREQASLVSKGQHRAGEDARTALLGRALSVLSGWVAHRGFDADEVRRLLASAVALLPGEVME